MSAFDHSPREPDQLRDQLRRLLRHRALIVLGLLLGALAGGTVSALGGQSYTATGEVVVQPISTAPFETGGVSADKQISMGTERQIAQSAAVADRAAELLDEPADPAALRRELRVSNPPETQILEFEYTADSPERAARRANAFVRAYLAHREATATRRITTTVAKLTDELKPLLAERGELDRRIAETADGPAREALRSERESLATRTADLQGRITGLNSLDTTPGDVVREGDAPPFPSGPGPAVLLVAGAVAGLAGGLLAAWVRSLLDPRAGSSDEVREVLRAPVLGALPHRRGGADVLEVGPLHGGDRAETYRTVALQVVHHPRFAEPGGLLVVSVGEHTGAVSTAVNLAAALAETGRDVLLVEADPRSPDLAERLPVRGAPVPDDGREPPFDRTGDRTDNWPGGTRLTVDTDTAGTLRLAPGHPAADAARALNSPEPARLLTASADRGEYAVVLTRPLPDHADAMAVAGLTRGVLVVCDPDRVHRDDLARARELVESVGGHLLGAVLHPQGRGRRRDPEWTERPEDRTGPRSGPKPHGVRTDTAYGSYGRYRRADDSTTLRT